MISEVGGWKLEKETMNSLTTTSHQSLFFIGTMLAAAATAISPS
jgi:hypothetical protein